MKLTPVEIVLFFIEDKNKRLENILGASKVVNEIISPAEMFNMCVWSIRKNMPNASITLFTDDHTNIHNEMDNIKICRYSNIRHDFLMFDLENLRKNYIQDYIKKNIEINLIFTDIDVLFNKDLSHIFSMDFDVCSPATFYNLKHSSRGIPLNSLLSTINCGIFFVRTNNKALNFYNAWIELMLYLNEHDELKEYGDLFDRVKKDFLKWWGEPHSLMVMFGNQFMAGQRDYVYYKDTKFKIIEDSLYNFAPEMIKQPDGNLFLKMDEFHFDSCYLFHMRGARKVFMRQVANKMGFN